MFLAISSIGSGLIHSKSNKLINLATLASGIIYSSVSVISNQAILSNTNTASVANFNLSYNAYFPLDTFKFIFGNNAYQDINNLIVSKSDLFGLNPTINNTAESLIVGLINRLLVNGYGSDFPKLSSKYWGYGISAGIRTDTVILNIRNSLSITSNEIADYDNNVDPDNY